MSSVMVSVEGLSKKYLIGHQTDSRNLTLRDSIQSAAASFSRKASDLIHGRQVIQGDEVEEFWALKDVSFEVREGEVLGVVGRNGAGKSTLLKVLSRITEPTTGRIVLRGRPASLLEVGTGFHSELTGRENIFLNGAILGMPKSVIRSRFDEIVAFSGVENFLDTPVKRYSSGMYMRLAFAVAAHLESDILIVDEVLAVGDAEFQKKCLGKLRSVSKSGRTVIFVSHQMSAVSDLCTSAIHLVNGALVDRGACADVIRSYMGAANTEKEIRYQPRPDGPRITRIAIDGPALTRGDINIEVDFQSPSPITPVPGIVICGIDGTPVFGSNPRFHKDGYEAAPRNAGTVRLRADALPLASGDYVLSVWLGDWQSDYDHKPDVIRFGFLGAASSVNRPSPAQIGHLDWPSKWQQATRAHQ